MQRKKAQSGGGNKVTAFLKRNIYYILMILCVLAIGSMITVAAVLNNSGGEDGNQDVVAPPPDDSIQTDTPKPKEFILSMPVSGEVILKYGDTYTDKKGKAKEHVGIDINAKADTNVLAPFDGTVTQIDKENFGFYGAVVSIDHGNGYVSKIYLLDNVSVTLNQKVTTGTIIGKVVSGDKAVFESALNKEHIHYELYKDGKLVNPDEFMANGNK